MSKIVIQVPFDEELLDKLSKMSKKQHEARAEIIRRACRHFVERIERDELDSMYRDSYKKMPENPALGQSQVSMLNRVLSKEDW